MPQAASQNTTQPALSVTADEALFLRCILQCQNDYGSKPIPELALPRSIGVGVDYDYVKRMMFTKMLRDDDNTDEGRARHRKRTKSAIKRADAPDACADHRLPRSFHMVDRQARPRDQGNAEERSVAVRPARCHVCFKKARKKAKRASDPTTGRRRIY
jgi:hypothetical protein